MVRVAAHSGHVDPGDARLDVPSVETWLEPVLKGKVRDGPCQGWDLQGPPA